MTSDSRLRVLLELRPAFDGYAGIPQETRLLYRGLCTTHAQIEGLLQTSHNFLAPGTMELSPLAPDDNRAAGFHRYSRVVISIETVPSIQSLAKVLRYLRTRRIAYTLTLSALLFPKSKIRTSRFAARHFEDFIWRALFEKTLPATDFALVTSRNFRVCTIPRNVLQSAGLNSLRLVAQPCYPTLETRDIDIFIAQTPYPARLAGTTALVVRYHDSFPVFMPHTIANRSRHEAAHYYALMCNVRSGAYFACVSETTRQGLLSLFPEVQDRAITIYNMISHHFHIDDSPAERVPGIIRCRVNRAHPAAYPAFVSAAEQERFYQRHLDMGAFNYLLVVSTLEPRKNHRRLISAWETVRAERDPNLRLVIVGSLGWDCDPIIREMRTWIDRGALFLLSDIPGADLRILYRHAAATVCPSLAEGFDFSGIEAMCSGGLVIASDIAVHREIYGDAAEYFNAYCPASLAAVIQTLLYDRNAAESQARLRVNARLVATRYAAEKILPQWVAFLQSVKQRVAGHG